MLLNRTRAFQVMEAVGLDALVATSADNVLYASDYECGTHWINKGAQIYALLTPGQSPQASLIAPLLEAEAIIGGDVWIEDVYLVGMFQRNYEYADSLDEVGRQTRALSSGRTRLIRRSMDSSRPWRHAAWSVDGSGSTRPASARPSGPRFSGGFQTRRLSRQTQSGGRSGW